MNPSRHFIFGIFFTGLLFLIFPKIGLQGFLIIFFSSFLIDFDHYAYHVFKKKQVNPLKAYSWFLEKEKKFSAMLREERNKFYSGFFVLHGLEILFLVFLISKIYSPAFFVFVGFGFHLILDSIDQPRHWDKVEKLSLIQDFFKHKNSSFIDEK